MPLYEEVEKTKENSLHLIDTPFLTVAFLKTG